MSSRQHLPASITFEAVPVKSDPRAGQPHESSASLGGLGNLTLEEFRVLRAKIRIAAKNPGRRMQRIGVVSAAAGEGKTFVAFGLARTLAQHPGHRVLLVEADVRKPSIEDTLGRKRARGLCEWLTSECVSVGVQRLAEGFDLLPAGLVSRPEALGSPRMTALLDAAARQYDTIIIDCPPLLPVADSLILQDLVDAFLFVVRFRHSPRSTIRKALERIREDLILGFVYNGHTEIIPSDYSYANRRYGY